MKLPIFLAMLCTNIIVNAQQVPVPDSVLQKHSSMICNCVTKTYNATNTKEQKLSLVEKCFDDVTSLYKYSEEAKEVKKTIELGGEVASNYFKKILANMNRNCSVFQAILKEKETQLPEPITTTNDGYFLDSRAMVAKKMTVKENDGQMRTWKANDMTNSKIQIVYDIRYQFASVEDAKTYYAAKLEFLSEKATEISNELKGFGASESNVYIDNSGALFGLDTKMKNYIFRIDNIIAKVFVSADGKANDAEILQFAKDAIARIKAMK